MGIRLLYSCEFIIWIAFCYVFTDLCSAYEFEDSADYSPTSLSNNGGKLKRNAEDEECVLPPPLENGRFYPSARRCHLEDESPACLMIPGTPVPHNWVIFFYCDPGYTLNTTKPVSICLRGRWKPNLPVCEVGASECSSHDHCPDNKTCLVGKCANSCEGLCGPNTDCEVSYHRPLCNCKKGYVGNPFKGCILGDPISLKLLLAQPTQVSVLDLTLSKIITVLHYTNQNPKENSPSVAYHYDKKYIFYTGPHEIFRDEVVGRLTRTSTPKAVVSAGVDANAKLAVDWIHNKLYWMSHTDETVEVTDLDGGNRTTLISSGVTHNWNLNNIVVDPYAGYIFLVSNDSLYRMNLDGTNFTRLHLDGEENRGVFVITLDTNKRLIYYSAWDLETATPYISSCDYDGKDVKDIPIGDMYSEIHAVDVFRDTLFFGNFKRGQSDEVWSVDLTSSSPRPVLIQTVDKGFLGLKVYHPAVQKEFS